MATQASLDLAQQMYIAYYGRPADPAGQEFWAEQFDASDDLTQALSAFGTSQEFTDNFGTLDNEALINNLFTQLFNRVADAEGLAFYTDRLDSGEATLASIAKQIADGAQNDDATILANKTTVANTYTAAVTEQGSTYEADDIADAQAILAAVDASEESVTAGNTAAEAEVASNVTVPGETFELTTGIADVVESGTGNDTITATTATMQSGDVVSDASTTDNDTMNITLSAASATTQTITNVENINVELDYFTGTAADFDATNVTGATITIGSSKLGFNGTTGVANAGANTVVAGANVDTLTVTGLNNGAVDTGSAETVNVDASATTKDVTITVNGDLDLIAGAGYCFR